MMRVEQIGDATLYLGDCRDVLPTLGKVDAVVTDPPYGIGADKAMHKASGTQYGCAAAPKRVYANTNWDSAPPSSALLSKVLGAAPLAIIFGGNYFHLPPSRCWLIWDKEVNGNFADAEMAWTNLNKPVRLIRHMWNGMLRKGRETRTDHPTQKPVGVMRWCLEQIPDAGVILDPFMGSGTTGVACAHEGRRFIGIEREPAYFDIACRRIAEAYAQPRLFEPSPPAPPVQPSMFEERAA